MQISLYIGTKRKKDRIVNDELSKYIEGDRSARIKDLILKGLIFEGKRDIDETLLDIRYMMGLDVEVRTSKIMKMNSMEETTHTDEIEERQQIEENLTPNFDNVQIDRKEIDDKELEDRI